MSISDKFRTWAEMDTQDDFIQYLERLVSGDASLSAASTASSRAAGINRPLARLAHNTDALADAVTGLNTRNLICTHVDGYISYNGTTVTFSQDWLLTGINSIEEGVTHKIASGTTVVFSGAESLLVIKLDRDSVGAAVATPVVYPNTGDPYSSWTSLQAAMAADSEKFDYIVLGVCFGLSEDGIYFFNGWTLREGERLFWDGSSSHLGLTSIQRSNSGTSAQIQGGGEITWDKAAKVLTWASPLKFFIPGLYVHEISAGSYTFTNHDRFLYFTADRDAAGTVTINPASDLTETHSDAIDISGFNGVDIILVGRSDNDSSCFTFADGRVVSDGTEISIDESPVVTFAVQDGSSAAEETSGNVGIAVSGIDGLSVAMATGSGALNDTANLSLTPLWHDRFLPFLMYSQSDDARVTRVVYDSANSADGELFTVSSSNNGSLNFEVPGYDSTLFTLRLDGSAGYPGLTLSDNEVAWIVLPSRDFSSATKLFCVGGGGTSASSDVHTGALSSFPEDDPDAYIIAYKYDSSDFDAYTFLGVKGIEDKVSIPLFEGARYKSLTALNSATAAGWECGKDCDIEFGWDEHGTYTTSPDMYYIRLSGSDENMALRRPGWTYTLTLGTGDKTTNGTGSTGKVVWEVANTTTPGATLDTMYVYVPWDPVAQAAGYNTAYALVDAPDEDFPTDDLQMLFGCFHFGKDSDGAGGTSDTALHARFVLWDGTQLDLNMTQTSVTYSGTPSRLLKELHEGLEAAMDGGSSEPSLTNKFVTVDETEATLAATISAPIHPFQTPMGNALGNYLPFLNFHKAAVGDGDSRPTSDNAFTEWGNGTASTPAYNVWTTISGFDRMSTRASSSSGGTVGASTLPTVIYINGGMAVFGNTYVWDANGEQIQVHDSDYWIGSDKTGANARGIVDDGDGYGDCPVSLMGSIRFGTKPHYYSSTSVNKRWEGHHWELRNVQATTTVRAKTAPFGKNYIYIRPVDFENQTSSDRHWEMGDGTSTEKTYMCNGITAKLSKHAPYYEDSETPDSDGNASIGMGLRKFGSSYGDDEGWWKCIGTVFLVYDSNSAHTAESGSGGSAETFDKATWTNDFNGPSDGTEPRANFTTESSTAPDGTGFSDGNVRAIPFTSDRGDVKLLLPLRIDHNIRTDTLTEYEGGVNCGNPLNGDSWMASYPASDFPHPNTGVHLASSDQFANGIAAAAGAALDLSALLPSVAISSVGFRLSAQLHITPSGGANADIFEFAVRPSKDNDADFQDETAREMTWAWGENQQGVSLEFDWPTSDNFFNPVFKTKHDGGGDIIFVDPRDTGSSSRAHGMWVTGYRENLGHVHTSISSYIDDSFNTFKESDLTDTDV